MLVRFDDRNGNAPFWCSVGPELIDVSITNWCDLGCPHCYKASSTRGQHMPFEDYQRILRQARNLGVLQVALGGGNPNQHPAFCDILRFTRTECGIMPSYTTNGRGLSRDVLLASKEYCGAVAVSLYEPTNDAFAAIAVLLRHGIRTNVHFLLSNKTIGSAIALLSRPPAGLDGINAVVFLNYKPIARCPDDDSLLSRSSELQEFFRLADRSFPFKIGFDSCSISGIARFMDVPANLVESCEAGRFSMYISEDGRMYPCSFVCGSVQGVSVGNANMGSVWRRHATFTRFRAALTRAACPSCAGSKICKGGCPAFPEINLC
jgi:radical SAM protein with 4Fe4S-binding SPASM domain